MGRSAYIKLVEGSKQQSISLNEVKELLDMYINRTSKTGEQLDWEYENVAFPYTVEEKTEGTSQYLYLKATDPLYNYLMIGVGAENIDGNDQHYIQIVTPDEDHMALGDKAKANEFAKYLGKYFQGELHLFNDRVIYNNPRK